MRRRNAINPHGHAHRGTLRLIGFVLVVVGGILSAVGLVSFFGIFSGISSAGGSVTGEQLNLFWCAFVGLPMLIFGLVLLKFGYMGTIARYMAGEVAPVGTDTFRYAAGETKGAVRDLAKAVGEGLRGEDTAPTTARCGKCGEINDAQAHFCDGCGSELGLGKPCGHCGDENDVDARFCNACGKPFPAL